MRRARWPGPWSATGLRSPAPAACATFSQTRWKTWPTAPRLGRSRVSKLARRESAPLLEDLRITAKVSQNLHAELILRAVARARRAIGTREAGLEEMEAFLDEAGIARGTYSFHDGSGLGRLNLVTPAAVVRLLRYMWGSRERENWLGLLPIGGQDGTLADRFAGIPAARRIRAKTGSLSHVAALSGYAESRDGRRLAFAIMVNNYNGSPGEIRGIIDQVCSLMVE